MRKIRGFPGAGDGERGQRGGVQQAEQRGRAEEKQKSRCHVGFRHAQWTNGKAALWRCAFGR